MKHRTRDEHLFDRGPKRLLAVDGGGVRGILALGYLKRIEDLLRARNGDDPEFRLCDYFDLIGGTSIGAVIAAGLALGYSVAQIQALFTRHLGTMFRKSRWRLGVWGAKYPTEAVVEVLKHLAGDIKLGGDELKTGLMVVAKRLDTGSPWLIHNNPRARFYSNAPDSVGNGDLLLRQVVRASAAAPHYFDPERFEIAPGVEGLFVDGGVSTANNPALQLFMLATMDGYGLSWPFGVENLLLVSVGTGRKPVQVPAGEKTPAIQVALQSLMSITDDCDWLNQTLLQWMSQSPNAWDIDAEVGDLRSDLLGDRALLSYLRYNVLFEAAWLSSKLGLDLDLREAAELAAMDVPEHMQQLARIGALAAEKQVREEHFSTSFDPT